TRRCRAPRESRRAPRRSRTSGCRPSPSRARSRDNTSRATPSPSSTARAAWWDIFAAQSCRLLELLSEQFFFAQRFQKRLDANTERSQGIRDVELEEQRRDAVRLEMLLKIRIVALVRIAKLLLQENRRARVVVLGELQHMIEARVRGIVLGRTGRALAITVGDGDDRIVLDLRLVPKVARARALIVDHDGATDRLDHRHEAAVVVLAPDGHEAHALVAVVRALLDLRDHSLELAVVVRLIDELRGDRRVQCFEAGDARIFLLAEVEQLL